MIYLIVAKKSIHMNIHVNVHVNKNMAWQKIEEKNTRKLSKTTRGSYLVRLPVDFVRSLKWKSRQKLDLELDKKRGRIIIKDWKK
jgi:hypothetical protein